MKVEKIKKIKARQILDSRGTPTVEVDVTTEHGFFGRASVPSGASTGSKEALELRDHDKNYYFGKSVLTAVNNVNKIIAKHLIGKNVFNQEELDNIMLNIDGTKNKSVLGANAILGVSLACLKAAADAKDVSLFKHINKDAFLLPRPMMNVINGGKHADNNLNIQEFMIVPVGACSYSEALLWCATLFHNLKALLKKDGFSTAVGDEGGFAPNFKSDEEALDYILLAMTQSGFKPKKDFAIALDVAANEMFEEAMTLGQKDKYYFWKTDQLFSKSELMKFYLGLIKKYPIISIEDPFAEDDWESWQKFTKKVGNKIQVVGDDLFVTNKELLKRGIEEGSANAILIKLNQIGSVTETLETIRLAQKAGFNTIISHRSGETEDNYIADFAVGTNAGQIKTGAPSRSDRVAKYNELLRIEEELGQKAKFCGNI